MASLLDIPQHLPEDNIINGLEYELPRKDMVWRASFLETAPEGKM